MIFQECIVHNMTYSGIVEAPGEAYIVYNSIWAINLLSMEGRCGSSPIFMIPVLNCSYPSSQAIMRYFIVVSYMIERKSFVQRASSQTLPITIIFHLNNCFCSLGSIQ